MLSKLETSAWFGERYFPCVRLVAASSWQEESRNANEYGTGCRLGGVSVSGDRGFVGCCPCGRDNHDELHEHSLDCVELQERSRGDHRRKRQRGIQRPLFDPLPNEYHEN